MREAMMEYGLLCKEIIVDGKLHRFAPDGKSNKDGWYVCFGNVGKYGDWSRDLEEVWSNNSNTLLSPAEKKKLNTQIAEAKHIRLEEIAKQQEESAHRAVEQWEQSSSAGESPYLERKQVKAFGVRFSDGIIAVPIVDTDDKLWSLQKIHDDGSKRFLTGGRKQGCFHVIGTIEGCKPFYIAEGYSTAASVYMATNCPCVIAFDAGNLLPVTSAMRKKYPDNTIFIAADNDQWKEYNTGKEKAEEAAEKHGCTVILPEFSTAYAHAREKPTDFNDLHVLEGLETVQKQLQRVMPNPDIALPPETLSGAVTRLSALPPLEYEQVRDTEAERLRVRVGILDKEVALARKSHQEEDSKVVMFRNIEIWPEPINGAVLLDELLATIQQFIVCERETAITASLWCVFTWVIDYVQVAPLAVITAPEKRCGKSQLLNLMGQLSRRPLVASNISPAAVYRVIEAHSPTLFIDEADTFFKENEELRGIINSGHTRQSAYVIRTVGDTHEPCQFSTWGAKAISGIGSLPETVMDRAVILELRRKLSNESVQRLRYAESGLFDRLSSKLARFSQDAGVSIGMARPELPEALNDRAQDNWEPLLAIADYAGGAWPQIARLAALKLSGAEQEAISLSAELLADIWEVFQEKRTTRITTVDLLKALTEDELKPWLTYNRGKPMSPRQLAKRLEEYGISSKNLKMGYELVRKGFDRSQFDDAFARYLTHPHDTPLISATPLPTGQSPVPARISSVAESNTSSATINQYATPEPAEILGGSGVAAKMGSSGMGMVEVEI